MPNQIKIRRDTASNFQTENPTLGAGEFSLETDTSKIKIGDGSTAYNSLQFIDGDAATALSSIVQGSSYAYSIGGVVSTGINSSASLTDIQRWSVTSDGNASDIGDITQGRVAGASATSTTHGYVAGGLYAPPNARTNTIYKFAFTSPHTATDVGNLTAPVFGNYGTSSPTHGYASGGRSPTTSPQYMTTHNKYAFASDGDATDDGDLTVGRSNNGSGGNSSALASYFAGGYPDQPTVTADVIDKIPFAAGGTATDIGNLTQGSNSINSGCNSIDNGYVVSMISAGGGVESSVNRIEKISYTSDGDAIDSQDLFAGVYQSAGSSSTTSGYVSGGRRAPDSPVGSTYTNIIQKFPFANTTTGTDVGDLATGLTYNHGNQS